MGKLTPREHIINTAIELFREYGYHATGVDRIIDEAGVSKKTLYTHFRSKEELLIAALRHYDGVFRNNFMRKVDQLAKSPKKSFSLFSMLRRIGFRKTNFSAVCLSMSSVSIPKKLADQGYLPAIQAVDAGLFQGALCAGRC